MGNLARRAGVEEDCILTGGVAHDKGIVQALEEYLGIKIQTSKYCQVNGAIGAALYGYQIYFKEKGL